MSTHNIVGCEALLTRGCEAREREFSPAHGSIRIVPRQRRLIGPLLIFAAGALTAVGAAALLATSH